MLVKLEINKNTDELFRLLEDSFKNELQIKTIELDKPKKVGNQTYKFKSVSNNKITWEQTFKNDCYTRSYELEKLDNNKTKIIYEEYFESKNILRTLNNKFVGFILARKFKREFAKRMMRLEVC